MSPADPRKPCGFGGIVEASGNVERQILVGQTVVGKLERARPNEGGWLVKVDYAAAPPETFAALAVIGGKVVGSVQDVEDVLAADRRRALGASL